MNSYSFARVLLGSLRGYLHLEDNLVQDLLLLCRVVSPDLLLDGFHSLVFDAVLDFLLWNHQKLVNDHHGAVVLKQL